MVAPVKRGGQVLEWARCGMARCGASPSNFYNQFITLMISGIDETSKLIKDSINIDEVLTNQPDTCSFEMITIKPSAFAEVLISLGDSSCQTNRIFAGSVVITNLKRIHAGEEIVYEINCIDFTQLLNKKLISKLYKNVKGEEIVKDLIYNYGDAEILTNSISGGAPIVSSIQFNYCTVAQALKELCEEIGWDYYIDYYKDVHFFDPVNEPAERNLSDTHYDFKDLQITEDCSQVINRITIEGKDMEGVNLLSNPGFHEGVGGSLPDYWQECYDGDGGSTFVRRHAGYDELGGKGELVLGGTDTEMSARQIVSPEGGFIAGHYYRFSIYMLSNYAVDGILRITEQTGGVSYYTDAIWELMGDEGDYTEWWVEHYIHDAANTELVVDVFHYSPNILYIDKARLHGLNKTILNDVNSQAQIADLQGGDGIYEAYEKDQSLESFAECQAKGLAILEVQKKINYQARWNTHDYNIRSGKVININLTSPTIDDNFCIRKVSTKVTGSGYMWRLNRQVEAATVRKDIIDIMKKLLEGVK